MRRMRRTLTREAEDDGTYVLDFNLAPPPELRLRRGYSCPLTPAAENRLAIRIEAGERLATN